MSFDRAAFWRTRRTALLGGGAAVAVAAAAAAVVVVAGHTGGTTVLAQTRAPLGSTPTVAVTADTPSPSDAPSLSPSPALPVTATVSATAVATPTSRPTVAATRAPVPAPAPATTRPVAAVPSATAPAGTATVIAHNAAPFALRLKFVGTGAPGTDLLVVTLAAGETRTLYVPQAVAGTGEGLNADPADDQTCGTGNGGESEWRAGETDHLEVVAVPGYCHPAGAPARDGVRFTMTFPDGHTFTS
jgi:hypothetical protein